MSSHVTNILLSIILFLLGLNAHGDIKDDCIETIRETVVLVSKNHRPKFKEGYNEFMNGRSRTVKIVFAPSVALFTSIEFVSLQLNIQQSVDRINAILNVASDEINVDADSLRVLQSLQSTVKRDAQQHGLLPNFIHEYHDENAERRVMKKPELSFRKLGISQQKIQNKIKEITEDGLLCYELGVKAHSIFGIHNLEYIINKTIIDQL